MNQILPPAEPLRILQLEDNADDAELELVQLRRAGLEFISQRVETREALVAALEQFRPNIVLADYKLPAFDGKSALLLVRQTHPEIPVVVVSGVLDDEGAVQLLKAGAHDFVLKDRMGRLGTAVQNALTDAHQRRLRQQAEQALRESELRFRSLVEYTSDVIGVATLDGTIRYLSPAASQLSGYEPRELLGRNYLELVVPEDQAQAAGYIAELIRQPGVPRTYETRIRRKDGSTRYTESVVRNLVDVPGIDGIVVNIRDITERKQAEVGLRMANYLIEQSPSILFRWAAGPGWPVVYVSKNVSQWGYEPEQLLNGTVPYASLIHPDDLPRVADEVAAYTASAVTKFTQEYRVLSRSGEVIWVDDRSVIERDAVGQPLFFQGVVTDISERKGAERETRESEQTLRAITGAAMDGVILMDDDGRVAFWNPAAEKILGYSQAEVMGQLLHELLAPSRYREEFRKQYAQFCISGEGPIIGKTVELQALHKDGSEVPVELAVSAVQLKGKWTAVGILRDVSERKQAQEQQQAEFRRAQVQLQALSQVIASPALAEGDLETLARQITEAAARACGAERANVWLFNEDETELRCLDLYEVTPARHSAGMLLKESEFRNEFHALKTARYVDAHDPLSDPRTRGYVESYLKPQRISSMLDAVIEASGRHLGLLCIEHVNQPHHWEPDEIAFASLLADKLGICLANRDRRALTVELQEAQRVAHLGHWRLDSATGEVSWSEEIFRIFGLDPAGPAPNLSRHRGLLSPLSFARLDAALKACLQSAQTFEIELELTTHPSGEPRWLNARGEAVRDTSGAVVAARGTAQDITARKNAELALRGSQQLIEGILNAMPVRVFWKDRNLSYLGCNTEFARDAGYAEPKDIVGKDDFQMAWREQAERYRGDDRNVIYGGQTKLFIEEPQTTPDGKTLTLLTSKLPLRDAGGVINGVLGTYMDITEHKQRERDLERTTRALRALSHGNSALVHAESEQQLYDSMCGAIVEAGGYRMAWVGLAEQDAGRRVRAVGQAGAAPEYVASAEITWGSGERGAGPTGECIRSGQAQISRDIANDPYMAPWRTAAVAAGFKSAISLPLKSADGQTFGALTIYSDDGAAFDAGELPLLTEMAGDLAYGVGSLRTAAEHRLTTGKLRRSLEGTIAAISSTMEMRDPYTAGHQRRVAELAAAIAQEMGLPALVVEGVHFGAMIHDLGKIQLPAEILSKPARLSKLEYELIKTHPQAGYDILKDIEFPWPVALMVLQHHERLDGSGYPQGLKGKEISLESRVLAVADVVEAMASHRPYRAGLGIAAALKEIEDHRGTGFDPAAVDACLKLFREQRFTLS